MFHPAKVLLIAPPTALVVLVAPAARAFEDRPFCANGYLPIDNDADGFVSPDEVMAASAEEFRQLDRDGNGSVSMDEYSGCRSQIGGRPSILVDRSAFSVSAFDENGDGIISQSEYIVGTRTNYRAAIEDRDLNGDAAKELSRYIYVPSEDIDVSTIAEDEALSRAALLFQSLDVDRDRQISREEWTSVAPLFPGTAADAETAFRRVDADKSGAIDEEEYLEDARRGFEDSVSQFRDITPDAEETTREDGRVLLPLYRFNRF